MSFFSRVLRTYQPATSNQPRQRRYQCRAIIETPKGCRNKFDYDPDSSLFILGDCYQRA